MDSSLLGFIEAIMALGCAMAVLIGSFGILFGVSSPRIFKLSVAWMIFWAIPVAWILLRWYFRLIHFLAVN